MYSDTGEALALGLGLGLGVFMLIIYLGVIILGIASMWILYAKAGEPGWASIIPIYNAYIMLKIGGKPWYWLLLMMVPFLNIVIAIMALQAFLKAFGKGDVGSVLLALFFSIIYFPYLAFSKNVTYEGVY